MIWLDKAKPYIGLSEVPGKVHNSKIVGWWKAIRAAFQDDETPWCAAFVGGVLEECGILSTRKANARSYLDWGVRIASPCDGCVVVLWRENSASIYGHVGFVVGRNQAGNLMVLGGNQGNKVSIAAFDRNRVLGYFWPKCISLPSETLNFYNLPVVAGSSKLSINEA